MRVERTDIHDTLIGYAQWPDSADGEIEIGERVWVETVPARTEEVTDEETGETYTIDRPAEGEWQMQVTTRAMTDDEVAEWHVRNPPPGLAERAGVDAFKGQDDRVAVSLGLLALDTEKLHRLLGQLRQLSRAVNATQDPTEKLMAFLGFMARFESVFAVEEAKAVVSMQVIDNDQEMAEGLMLHRMADQRAKAEAFLQTDDGRAFLAELLGGE